MSRPSGAYKEAYCGDVREPDPSWSFSLIMVGSAVLRVSLLVLGAIAPAFATPLARDTVLTPFGDYAAENVHEVPAG
ncbi:hypothetical protein DL93DRAFT_2164166 [Clavulina sp. PMI_390]|nr:hypothetical protein DL93DRAFT_2164166 [Clavulina sp. PMI_390]